MTTIEKSQTPLKGVFVPPSDKSISHRAVFISSLANGTSIIKNFLNAEDPLKTLSACTMLGVDIESSSNNTLIVRSKGIESFKEPENVIDCGNSGTTMRLLSGIVSGFDFLSILSGDDSLIKRPMLRIITPLRQMGAKITARQNDRYPPLVIKGTALNGITYNMPIASAQVKSCVLLAGLLADASTEIIEPHKSRDHTERMLKAYGANITKDDLKIKITGPNNLEGNEITIPGDISSAAFIIAASIIIKNSEVIIKNVGLNPTRTGFITALEKMGALIEIQNKAETSGEPVGDIICKYSADLKEIALNNEDIPSLIDELPILCVLATQAKGLTRIHGASELRVKESDRIRAITDGLRLMGAEVDEFEDGLEIKGPVKLKGAAIETYNDHRIAMAFTVAGLIAEGKTTIMQGNCVDISFPFFYDALKELRK
ncbi:3-phosphoshikimate 1-carboxyvinyltransferase [Candidatus Magnetoovum chiemensis]|nr:3-phosphoshikimate 1-carboxyvinyltransferase [Candidatus Magnetoovum chiemensis]